MSGVLRKLHRNDVCEREINASFVELLRDKSHWLPEANGLRQRLLEVIGLSQRRLEANGFHATVGEAKLKNKGLTYDFALNIWYAFDDDPSLCLVSIITSSHMNKTRSLIRSAKPLA